MDNNNGAPWTAELNRTLLKRVRQKIPKDDIAHELGRSTLAIRCQLDNLFNKDRNYNKYMPLDDDEIKTFREDVSYGKTIEQLALSYELPAYQVKEYINQYKNSMTTAYGGKPIDESIKESIKEPEETVMKLFKIETVIRIDGNDVDNYSDDKLIELIHDLEKQANSLAEIETHSVAIDNKIIQLEDNAKAIVAILDARIK